MLVRVQDDVLHDLMMRARVVLALVAVMAGVAASAGEVHVRLAPHPSATGCLRRGAIVATASPGSDIVRVALQDAAEDYVLALPDERNSWEIAVASEGCWSESVLWTDGEPGAVSLSIFTAATLSGTFEHDHRPPRRVDGSIYSVAMNSQTANPTGAGMRIDCDLQFPIWQCVAPADVPFDLRLDLAGFASVHYWGVIADKSGKSKLEPRRLYRGGSIAGWVHDSGGRPLAKARLSLYTVEAEISRRDTSRRGAQRHSVVSNSRGFFQFSGLLPGGYRVVSEVQGLSPARLSEVRVREGESVVWPRSLVHVPLATLDLTLVPATRADGSAWIVELSEKAPLHLRPATPKSGRGTLAGRWSATGVRADVYQLSILDGDDSELERLDVDLSEGGAQFVTVNVRTLVMRGSLHLADAPLEADLTFSDRSGKTVRASSDADGRFRAVFPSTGKWSPEVRYPRNTGGTVTLPAIIIDPAQSAEIELRVPGGRITGRVTGPTNTPERAAVHVVRDGSLVAQVTTSASGKFDFIGIKAGDYAIEAEGENSATPAPIQFSVDEEGVAEVQVSLAPLRRIRGTVVTPHGTPASGAVIQFLIDGGRSWNRVVTDVTGSFDYRMPAGRGDVTFVVLTYSYPSALVRVPADVREAISVSLRADGGVLRVRNAAIPYVRTRDVSAPMRAFFFPEPFGRLNGGVHLEPGSYVICPNRGVDSTCRSVVVAPGAEIDVDFKQPTADYIQESASL